MDKERSRKIQELYHAAVELPPEARAAFLAQADAELRREVESLLSYDASSTAGAELLARPVVELAAGLLEVAAPPPRIGNYRILSTLGSGGMGVVYRAEQEHPRRIVALKLMRPGWSNPELLERFERESHALGRLQHPGIAQIYEAGNAETGAGLQPYFAMELIEGESLLKYAEAHRLNTRARLEIMRKICDAVHHAHRRGIIHRDLKPGNILVDNTGQPKILDFGVARMTDGDTHVTRQTDLGQLVGTLAYMSPEQVLGDPLELDTRSDVYALGVILYQFLAGRLPYTLSPRLHQAVQTIRETDPAPLSSISQNYRGDIETIVAKALEKDKSRRYTSAADLAADIRRYLEDEPIAARPPSAAYQLRKFARRHRALVAGLAAVFIVLAAGVVASTWQAVRANRAGRIAVAERDRAIEAERKAQAAGQAATAARNRALAAQAQAIQERNRAVAEEQRADNETATAKAVSDFLQNDLLAQAGASSQATPNTKPDPDLKVRTALDRAAARIPGKFDKQPLVEASIRQTIADTYRDLGLYPQAQSQLQQAIALRSRIQGEQHRDTLTAMNDLAEIFTFEGKYPEARSLDTKVLTLQRRALGDNNPATLATRNNLGNVYEKLGQYPEAAQMLSQTMDGFRRLYGEQNRKTQEVANDLALVYVRQGRLSQAEPLYSRAAEVLQRLLGEQHPDTLNAMNDLAQLYYREGKYAQAEAMQSKVLSIRRRVLGNSHFDTLVSMNNLAVAYEAEGKLSQAEQIETEDVDGLSRALGPDHPNTLVALSNLARIYSEQSKYAQSEELNRKVLDTRSRVLGAQHPSTLASMSKLAGVYLQEAKYSQAEPLLTKVLEIRRRKFGPQHPDTIDALASLGELHLRQRRYTEAEPMLRQALAAMDKTAPQNWKRFYLQGLLGAALSGQTHFVDAEPLLLSSYDGLQRQKATIPAPARSYPSEVGAWVVGLYRDWGRADKAGEWQQKLEHDNVVAVTAQPK